MSFWSWTILTQLVVAHRQLRVDHVASLSNVSQRSFRIAAQQSTRKEKSAPLDVLADSYGLASEGPGEAVPLAGRFLNTTLLVAFISAEPDISETALDSMITALKELCADGWRVSLHVDVPESVAPTYTKFLKSLEMDSSFTWSVFVFTASEERVTHPFALMCKYRARWLDAVHDFDWFLVTEHDLAYRSTHIKAIVDGFHALKGTDYIPGLLRYKALTDELSSESEKEDFEHLLYLTDLSQIGGWVKGSPIYNLFGVTEIKGRRYLIPRNPYQASVLLPQSELKDRVASLGADEFTKCGLTNAYTKEDTWREQMNCFFYYRDKTKVIPIDLWSNMRLHMIHHRKDKYAKRVGGECTRRLPAAQDTLSLAQRFERKGVTGKEGGNNTNNTGKLGKYDSDGYYLNYGKDEDSLAPNYTYSDGPSCTVRLY